MQQCIQPTGTNRPRAWRPTRARARFGTLRGCGNAASGVALPVEIGWSCPAECKISGGHGGGETPVPIPNTAVKPARADGTWGEAPWESRSPPGFLTKPPLSFGSRGFRTFWAESRPSDPQPVTERRQLRCDTAAHAGRRGSAAPPSAAPHDEPPPAGAPDARRGTSTRNTGPRRHSSSSSTCRFVVAVSQAADQLNAALGAGHFHTAIVELPAGVLRHLVGLGQLHLVRLGLRRRRPPLPPPHLRPDHRGPDPRRRGRQRLHHRQLHRHDHRLRRHAHRHGGPVAPGRRR